MQANSLLQCMKTTILALVAAFAITGCGSAAANQNGSQNPPPPPPPGSSLTISNVGATSITNSGATISWSTNLGGTSQVDYGTTTQYGSSTTLDTNSVTSHSVALTGLEAATTYDFRVRSKDSTGVEVPSANFTFTTTSTAPPQGPVISAVSASPTANGATITWTTDKAADQQVSYGTTTSYGQSSPLGTTLSTSHSVTLSGLTASTSYDYQVLSHDSSGVLSTSGNFTFTTGNSSTAPVISNVQAVPTSTGASITWTTDQPADDQVDYGTSTSYGQSSAQGTTLSTAHSATLTGLNPSTTYDYRVKSRNAAGTLTTSGNFTFTTFAMQGLTLSYINAMPAATTATVSWRTNINSDTQVDYGPTSSYGQSTNLDSTPVGLHSAVINGLSAGTTYNFRVKSHDASNNLVTSGNFTFTTNATTDAPVALTQGWNQIPSTHLQDVCPPATASYDFPSNCFQVIAAWSGGIDDLARNRLIVWGGGHAAYYGNEVYAFGMGNQKLTRLNNPGPVADPNLQQSVLADGTPNSRHTYGGITYIAHADRMFVFGGAPACNNGFAANDTWTFNLSTLKWQAMDPTNGDGPPAHSFGVVADYDPNTQAVYLHDGLTFWKYTFETNTYTALDSSSTISIYNAAVIDPKRQMFFIMGDGFSAISIAPGSTYTMQDWSQQVTGCDALKTTEYPGLAYDPVQDRIVGWTGGNTVYVFNPDTKTCTATTFPNGPGSAQANGTHGRFRYMPGINAFAVVNDSGENAYIFKF